MYDLKRDLRYDLKRGVRYDCERCTEVHSDVVMHVVKMSGDLRRDPRYDF